MTPLERVRSIPGLTATGNDHEIRVNAVDFHLVARNYTGKWHFIDEQCSVPKAPYHLTLRKIIHDTLNP